MTSWKFDLAQWRTNMCILRQHQMRDPLLCDEVIDELKIVRKRSFDAMSQTSGIPTTSVRVTSEGIIPVHAHTQPPAADTKPVLQLLRSSNVDERAMGAHRIISAHECTSEIIDALIYNAKLDETFEIYREGRRVASTCAPQASTLAAMKITERNKWCDKRGEGNRAAILAIERCGGIDGILTDVVQMANAHICENVRRECARIVAESGAFDTIVREWLTGGDAFRLLGALEGCKDDAFLLERIELATSSDLALYFHNMFGACSTSIIKRHATPALMVRFPYDVADALMEKMINIVLTPSKNVRGNRRDDLASSKLLALRVVHMRFDELHPLVVEAIANVSDAADEDGGVRYAIRAMLAA